MASSEEMKKENSTIKTSDVKKNEGEITDDAARGAVGGLGKSPKQERREQGAGIA